MQKLLHMKMTRLEFLQFLGVAALTVFGIGNLMAYMSKFTQQDNSTGLRIRSGHGFGSRGFGE